MTFIFPVHRQLQHCRAPAGACRGIFWIYAVDIIYFGKRTNSNFGLQAAELLRHPILQPYVLKVNLKLNSVRRSSLSTHWPETEYIKKTRFANPEDVPVSTYKEKRHSLSNDRTLNPSISVTEDYMAELSVGSTHEDLTFGRKVISKASNVAKTLRLTPSKASATVKKQLELSKNRESVSHWN